MPPADSLHRRMAASGGEPGIWAPAITEDEGSSRRAEHALERREGDRWIRVQTFGSMDAALEALDAAVGRGEGTADHYRIVELGRARWKTLLGVAVAAIVIAGGLLLLYLFFSS
jgi:hypothetical protein